MVSFAMIPSLTQKQLSKQSVRMPTSLFSTASDFVKSYQLDGIGEGNQVNVVCNTGHTLCTDIPKTMGGRDSGPQPVETLLAAWMGCTQATATFVGRQMTERVPIQNIEFVNIEAFRDERGALQLPIEETPAIPSRLQRITGTIRVHTRTKEDLSSEQMELLKEQTEIRCPVANMIISSGCSIDVQWVNASSKLSRSN